GLRCGFEGGSFLGQGRVYLHPDQGVPCLELAGDSIYRQAIRTTGPLTLLFFATPGGGRARVEWRGVTAEVDVGSDGPGGSWKRVTVTPVATVFSRPGANPVAPAAEPSVEAR
ncbi:MAG TPA: hypothetical protein VFM29_00470, partial [Vicinamibacteria bacterium]|nr:hypothetical protein [Vicinamibacteria bacterium]